MKYTGERCMPGIKGLELLELEHRARYALALSFAQDAACLDLGSGSGYGASMLTTVAASVLGVDLSQEAVDFATDAFGEERVRFCQADVCADDFVDRVRAMHPEPFGCITCFEVLEHIEQPRKLLAAIEKLLTPDGVLLISTPNIDYPYDVDKVNPHHFVEYSLDEFQRVLSGRFEQAIVMGQQVQLISTIGHEAGAAITPHEWRTSPDSTPKYYLAMCTNREAPLPPVATGLITGDAHLKVVQSKLAELRQDQAHKAERLRLLEEKDRGNTALIQFLQAEVKRYEAIQVKLPGILEQFNQFQQEHRRQQDELRRLTHDQLRFRDEFDALRGHRIFRIFSFIRRNVDRFTKPSGKGKSQAAQGDSEGSSTAGPPPSQHKPRTRYIEKAEQFDFKGLLDTIADGRDRERDFALVKQPSSAFTKLRGELVSLPQPHKVSVIMPSYNRADSLRTAVESVQAQSYTEWELLIVDDGSTDDTKGVVEALASKDERIRYEGIAHSGVSAARDTGLKAAQGDIIAYLDSDNAWHEDYLLFMVHALLKSGKQCGYCALRIVDHDEGGTKFLRHRHFHLRDLLRNNYIDINIFMHRRSLYEELGGFDRGLRRWVDWDLILRYVAHHDPIEVPLVLADYARHKKLKQITYDEPFTYKNAVLNKHLVNWQRLQAEVGTRVSGFVSIIVPVYDNLPLTQACIHSLRSTNAGLPFEVILVDNGSKREVADGLAHLAASVEFVRLVTNYENYGFSLGNNIGFAESMGEFVVLLNNDTEVTDGWLEALISPLRENPTAGATGARLLYGDGTVQCAGIVFSERSKMPYHIYRNAAGDAPQVMKPRTFQALTGACLAMRADDFAALGGLSPLYANGCEDLDLCFRIRLELGKTLHYCPKALVYHHEGRTEGRGKFIMFNREMFVKAWGDKVQPDDTSYYAEDGFEVIAYQKPGAEPDGETAAYVPELRGVNGQAPPPVAFQHAQSTPAVEVAARAHRVGVVSIWHVRGIALHAMQYCDALEQGGLETHVLARWESERFDNSGPVAHPRVANGGDDPSPEDTVRWARDNNLDMVLFMEVHPKDWKRVAALKEAGIRVMAYENLDILRREHLADYAQLDALFSAAFYSYGVFREQVPTVPALLIPWGTPPGLAPAAEPASTDKDSLDFVHIAGWGGVNNRKNTDILIRAFAQAAPSNARLHLYTQAPVDRYGEDCARLLANEALFVVHEGTIPDIFAAYEGKDMLLWPSKREGLGLPIMEALACGLPVLIADGYMMKQWIIPGEHGVVVPAEPEHGRMWLPEMNVDEGALAEALRTLADNPADIARMRAAIQRDRAVWEWSWQSAAMCEQFTRFIQEPGYAFPEDHAHIPELIRTFEQRRREAFGEAALPIPDQVS